jgi:hypothetical protein
MHKTQFEVWAQLLLSDKDVARVREFLSQGMGIKPKYVVSRLHMTLYHARRPMPDLVVGVEEVNVIVPASQTRFMVMAPGGENPRPEFEPAKRKVGIRVQKQSQAMPQLQALRRRLIRHETPAVLGRRERSTARTSAFGARSFQPHMTLIRAGSGIQFDLKPLGDAFRSAIDELRFDRYLIEQVRRSQ